MKRFTSWCSLVTITIKKDIEMKLFCSLTVVFLVLSLSLFSFSGRNKVESAKLEPITVVGQIGVYGNEPHTWLGFVDDKGVEYGLEASEVDLKVPNPVSAGSPADRHGSCPDNRLSPP